MIGHPRIVGLLAVAVVAAACSSGGGGDDAAVAATSTVTVQTFDFQPDPITMAAGSTVTFVNEDAIDHTVTAGTRENPTPEVFDGQLPEQGATFALTLDEPGTYEYFCTLHPGPGMTGVIEVQ